jgi:hypothetical protein
MRVGTRKPNGKTVQEKGSESLPYGFYSRHGLNQFHPIAMQGIEKDLQFQQAKQQDEGG